MSTVFETRDDPGALQEGVFHPTTLPPYAALCWILGSGDY
jgi:hypothetical protein